MLPLRHSLRRIFGIYEHELHPWLQIALKRVRRVLDVGAHDGYYTLGCSAALRDLGSAEIIAFEPQESHVHLLRKSIGMQTRRDPRIQVVQAMVGRAAQDGVITLDALRLPDREDTLIKIDVEGAEIDVILGATTWLRPTNLFVIEVHKPTFIDYLKRLFAEHDLSLVQINQRPLRFVGRETRDQDNCWLVSSLTSRR
jgi:hypothetical protein